LDFHQSRLQEPRWLLEANAYVFYSAEKVFNTSQNSKHRPYESAICSSYSTAFCKHKSNECKEHNRLG
jgi:hypothetical protein